MKRPATVLVMVVAILVMLFVIGVTFLTTVTFESQSIDGAKKSDQQAAVVNRLSREVGTVLRENFLGKDGKAWNRDSEAGPSGTVSAIGSDTYGEIPGVNPILASIEPHFDDSNATSPTPTWFFRFASDLELGVRDIPLTKALDDGAGATAAGTNLVHIDEPLGDGSAGPLVANGNPFFPTGPLGFNFDSDSWREIDDGVSYFNVGVGTAPTTGGPRIRRRDADGDGVWDSYEYELPLDRFPPTMRGSLANQLRPDGVLPGNTIYYALRVIPHGGMVDVGHAHETLLEAVAPTELALPPAPPPTGCVGGPYIASGEERLLRRRFLLPPRDIPFSNLQSRLTPVCDSSSPFFGAGGQIPETLYRSFVPEADWTNFFAPTGSPNIRWWPINTGLNGSDITIDIQSGSIDAPGWLDWMDPNTTLTPSKYDHRHLITTVSHDDNLMRLGRDAGAVDDWVEAIIAAENPPPPAPAVDNFSMDSWPDNVNNANPTDPLNGRLKISLPGLVASAIDEANSVAVTTLDDVVALSPGNVVYDRFVRTIQDAFMLMLRNVDLNLDGTADAGDSGLIAVTAAALTANLIDFADTDDIPSRVAERDPFDGTVASPPVYAYGLERQPYITELYHNGTDDSYGIELYNPYAMPAPAISLNGFKLVIDGRPPIDLTGATNNIGPSGYFVVSNDGASVSNPDLMDNSGWFFTATSVVDLVRGSPTGDIVVDRFDVSTYAGAPLTFGTPAADHSVQRAMGNADPDERWKALVPVFEEVPGETLGAVNSTSAMLASEVRPVQIDFANTGDMATAFPTTGSLLLLGRYANTNSAPFNRTLWDNTIDSPHTKIDNGHMPVFDTPILDPPAPPNSLLAIPWGQLVFDYFTALPLEHVRDTNPVTGNPGDMIPMIDEGGLRVHGRIDINAAPWTVLAGLPLAPMNSIPTAFRSKIETAIFGGASPNPSRAQPIGPELAQSIVAYREARQITVGGDSTADYATRLRDGTGFLTVGELANVRGPGASPADLYNIDGGEIDGIDDDYVRAVAVLVALGDWVTTKSHVFTIYGTLRGAGTKSAVDEKAIRFQETVDRLPSFFNNRLPQRIGRRTVGAYTQADQD